MACCLLLAALLTHINEWLLRRGFVVTSRTNPFPTLPARIDLPTAGTT
jgi:hypothetical protein